LRKYISSITILFVIFYFYIRLNQENSNEKKYNFKRDFSSKSTIQSKHIVQKRFKNKKKKSTLDEVDYKNLFAYFLDNGIDIPIDENDIMSFIHTTLKKTKDYHNFIQALLEDFSLFVPEDDNHYIFLGYFDTIKSDLVEKEIFKSLENTNEALEQEKWSALLASIELKTKEGRDKVTSLLKSSDDTILKSNYISSLANSVIKTEDEKREIQKVLNPYLYDKNLLLRAAAITRSYQWNDLMKNSKPIEDALSSKDLSIKSVALFSISQTDEVPLKLKDRVFSIMNDDEIDYSLRVEALNTLVVYRDKLSNDEMKRVREFGKTLEEQN